jgi:cytochrome c oxidase assembly factor CtaG
MQAFLGIGELLALLLLAGLLITYLRGWRRLRYALPTLATHLRLIVFLFSIIVLALAFVWPLPGWSNYLLTMRSLQKVCICLVGAPLFWLSAPVHTIAWGMRMRWGGVFLRLHQAGWANRVVANINQPMVAWFAYVGAFLCWHDPSVARYLLGLRVAHTLAPWVLLVTAILFWWPIIDSGPRLHRSAPAWLLIISIFCVEIANMVTGVTIAFTAEPLYPYYTAVRAQLPLDALPWSQSTDQMAGGAIIWVVGSFVYFSSIVFVLFRLFHKEGSTAAQPLTNWDDNDKFIAPGLEHRVAQNRLRNVDLSHH